MEKYPLQGIIVMGKYPLTGRNHLEKFRLVGMTDCCSWCTLFNIEREQTTSSLSNGPRLEALP